MTGTTLSHYKIVAELGRGGMGIVYKAEDTKLDRTVAIKVLPASALSNEDDRARFYREAKAAAKLNHPNIAAVYEIDEAIPEGEKEAHPFIAMEYIDGQGLDEHVKTGPLDLEEAVRISGEIAEALGAAHENGVVHRDVKSSNVMLTSKGRAKVLDFGLAKTAHSTMLTRMGSTMGTVSYMSPEQARGEEVDARTDLWALGVVMYELITGRHPFPGDYEQAVVYGILNEDPQPLTAVRSGLPTSMDWIVGKLLAKKKEERYQNASDLLVDLKTADLTQTGLSRVSSASVSSMAPAAAPKTRGGAKYLPYALLAVGLVSGFAASIMMEPASEQKTVRHTEKFLGEFRAARYPALSNDGRYLALGVLDSLGETSSVQIYDFMNDSWASVLNSVSASWISFSHDGTKIAFISSGALNIASVAGGVPTIVSNSVGLPPLWLPDGSILFNSSISEKLKMNVDGSLESFSLADSSLSSFWFNDILPDGKTLLVTSLGTNYFALWGVDLETDEAFEILRDGVWTAKYVDSGHLVIHTGVSGTVHAFPFSVSELRVTGLPEVLYPEVSAIDWSVSSTGHLANFSGNRNNRLEMMALTNEGAFVPLLDELMNFEEFQLSPDGTKLVAEINTFQNDSDQIMYFDLASGASNQVTFLPFSHYEPTFSPEQDRIAVATNERGAQNIVVKSLDGLQETLWLTDNSNLSQDPDWSPSGRFIVYDESSPSTGTDIWKYSFEDSTAVPLVAVDGSQSRPRISHDNRFVTYQSNQSGGNQIFVYDMETGATPIVTQEPGTRPVWGSEAKQIFFLQGRNLMTVPVDISDRFSTMGQPTVVADIGGAGFFDIGPDNEIILAKDLDRETLLLDIVLNWTSTFKSE